MWIILGVLLSLPLLALESLEVIRNVKIIRILPDNIIVLNRGLEDGIIRNDHAKISHDSSGYNARALCLRTSQDLSYWKLYRIPHSESFSLDNVYNLVGISDKEIPLEKSRLRDEIQNITSLEGATKSKAEISDPLMIRRDLPEKLTERDLIESITPERRKLFIEKTFNRDQLERDLQSYRVSVFASPFARQSINEGESLRYGFRGGNIASKYRLLTQFEQQRTKLKDTLTGDSVSTSSTSAQAQFIVHQLTPSYSTLSLINYSSLNFSRLGTPRDHWQFGLIGFTWHLYQSKSWEFMDLSYIPLYDQRTTDVINSGGARSLIKTSGLRHGFRLALKTRINEKVAFENLLWVRPFQELSNWGIKTDDLNLINDLKLVFTITNDFFLDYNLVYMKDKLWRSLNNLPESNIINSVNLRYDFDL
jgi:hypothetical protein